MDQQTLDIVRESPVTTQTVDVPEARDSGSLLDASGGSDVAGCTACMWLTRYQASGSHRGVE